MRAVPLNRYLIFFAVAGIGLAADLATKAWMFDWLGMPPSPARWLWKDVFGFETSLNPGVLFGFGGEWPAMRHVACALSIFAAVAILAWLFLYRAANDLLLTIALGCVMGGVFGNLYDRLGLPGLTENGVAVYKVRDWILLIIPLLQVHWPNFNVADSLLVCGACLVIWHAFTADDRQEPAEAAQRPGQDSPHPQSQQQVS